MILLHCMALDRASRMCKSWTRVLTAVLYLVNLIKGLIGGFEGLANGLEVDAMLAKQRLILLKAVNKLPLVRFLLTSAWWLRRHHFALDASFDTVCTWLILIAPNLALLTEDTAVTPSELHRRVVCHGDLALARECSHIRGRRGRHSE